MLLFLVSLAPLLSERNPSLHSDILGSLGRPGVSAFLPPHWAPPPLAVPLLLIHRDMCPTKQKRDSLEREDSRTPPKKETKEGLVSIEIGALVSYLVVTN